MIFNDAIAPFKLPSSLKMGNIKAVFKKGAIALKETYKPTNILPLISTILGRIVCKQLIIFCDDILSKYQCRFRKGLSSQHCLFLMLEKWRKAVDNKEAFVSFLNDLFKGFWLPPSWTLIVKLHAYSPYPSSLKLDDYLLNRKRRIKVNSNHSLSGAILEGVQ